MSIKQLFNGFAASDASVSSPFLEWEGGDGWIVVSGTFTGAAKLTSFGVILSAQVGVIGVVPISPITAAGTYAFNAPRGAMQASLIMGIGDGVSALTVSIVSMGGSEL
jgi:hypothetical protein